MKAIRRAMPRVLLLLALVVFAVPACATGNQPGGSPSPTATAEPPSPSPSATPSPTPTITTPPPTTTAPSGWTVVSSRVAYQWRWPNADSQATVQHSSSDPVLVSIGAANHPNDPGTRPYNRMSFSFNFGYPTYSFQFVNQLVGDGSGLPIPLAGKGVLRVVFHPARAHKLDGTASTIVSRPPANLGLSRMVAYANAGDFEGYVTYGIGITWPDSSANPQIPVRVYEVTYVNPQGVHRYVVAFDVDAR